MMAIHADATTSPISARDPERPIDASGERLKPCAMFVPNGKSRDAPFRFPMGYPALPRRQLHRGEVGEVGFGPPKTP